MKTYKIELTAEQMNKLDYIIEKTSNYAKKLEWKMEVLEMLRSIRAQASGQAKDALSGEPTGQDWTSSIPKQIA